MAHITQVGNKWRAEVCIDRKRRAKSFSGRDAAEAWADLQEGKQRVSPIVGKALSSSFITKEEIVANALPFCRIGGIYFLTLGAEIVYVGKSTHLMRRLAQHYDRAMKFDGYYFILCDQTRANVLEEHYIKEFRPQGNTVFNRDTFIEEPQAG